MAVTKAMALLDEFQTAGTRAGEGGRLQLMPEVSDPAMLPAPPAVAGPGALPRLAFDDNDLDEAIAIAAADQAIRNTRLSVDRIRLASRLDEAPA